MTVPPFARMDRDIPVPQPSIEEKGMGGNAFLPVALQLQPMFKILAIKVRTRGVSQEFGKVPMKSFRDGYDIDDLHSETENYYYLIFQQVRGVKR